MPSESRLTLGSARRNKRRAAPLRARVPSLRKVPGRVVDACGRALRRSAPLLILLAVAMSIGAGVMWSYRFITTSPRFAIAAIEIRGTHTLSPEQLRARLPVSLGENIFKADLDSIEAAVESEAWVAGATVRRRLPRTIEIEVREREAAAVVALGELYLADANGKVFKRARLEDGEGAGLPIVSGLDRDAYAAAPDEAAGQVRDALATLAGWSDAARPRIGEIRLDGARQTLFTYDDAIAIRLGAADGDRLIARLDTFDAAWSALTPEERARARAIHLDQATRPDHVTVAFAR